jgi:hypothetical protein
VQSGGVIFLTHKMVELQQMANGIGPEAWSAIARFHELAAGAPTPP